MEQSNDDVYYRVIHQTPDKQVRLTINNFRGVEYLHLREYYLDFSEEWLPSNKGVAMPLDMNNSRELFYGLLEILSLGETKEALRQHFTELLEVSYPDEEFPGLRE